MNYTKMAKYLVYEAALNVNPDPDYAEVFGGAFGVGDRKHLTETQYEHLTEALRKELDRMGDRLRKQNVIT